MLTEILMSPFKRAVTTNRNFFPKDLTQNIPSKPPLKVDSFERISVKFQGPEVGLTEENLKHLEELIKECFILKQQREATDASFIVMQGTLKSTLDAYNPDRLIKNSSDPISDWLSDEDVQEDIQNKNIKKHSEPPAQKPDNEEPEQKNNDTQALYNSYTSIEQFLKEHSEKYKNKRLPQREKFNEAFEKWIRFHHKMKLGINENNSNEILLEERFQKRENLLLAFIELVRNRLIQKKNNVASSKMKRYYIEKLDRAISQCDSMLKGNFNAPFTQRSFSYPYQLKLPQNRPSPLRSSTLPNQPSQSNLNQPYS